MDEGMNTTSKSPTRNELRDIITGSRSTAMGWTSLCSIILCFLGLFQVMNATLPNDSCLLGYGLVGIAIGLPLLFLILDEVCWVGLAERYAKHMLSTINQHGIWDAVMSCFSVARSKRWSIEQPINKSLVAYKRQCKAHSTAPYPRSFLQPFHGLEWLLYALLIALGVFSSDLRDQLTENVGLLKAMITLAGTLVFISLNHLILMGKSIKHEAMARAIWRTLPPDGASE